MPRRNGGGSYVMPKFDSLQKGHVAGSETSSGSMSVDCTGVVVAGSDEAVVFGRGREGSACSG